MTTKPNNSLCERVHHHPYPYDVYVPLPSPPKKKRRRKECGKARDERMNYDLSVYFIQRYPLIR